MPRAAGVKIRCFAPRAFFGSANWSRALAALELKILACAGIFFQRLDLARDLHPAHRLVARFLPAACIADESYTPSIRSLMRFITPAGVMLCCVL